MLTVITFVAVFTSNTFAATGMDSENYRIQYPDLNFGAVIPLPSETTKPIGATTTPSPQPSFSTGSIDVVEFKVSSFLDSFMNPLYIIKIKNNGDDSVKLNGRLNINNKNYMKFAGTNIDSGSIANIKCLDENDSPDTCVFFKKPFIGILKANIEISTNETTKNYGEEKTTLVFPFSLTFFLITVIIAFVIIRKALKKKQS